MNAAKTVAATLVAVFGGGLGTIVFPKLGPQPLQALDCAENSGKLCREICGKLCSDGKTCCDSYYFYYPKEAE